ncbi:hypothetical protein Tco_0483453 [Tanacetum coccineum]
MDDEPMWVVDRVVALTPGFAITIPKITNEFAIKGDHLTLVKGNQFDEILRNCHGHNLPKGNIIKIFYHGLNKITQEVLNSADGGIFLYKTPNQAYQLLEDKVLLKLDWAKKQKPKSSLKKTVAFSNEGSSNSDIDKIMARMDAMTMKMDVQYKEMQSRSNHSIPKYDGDDKPMIHDWIIKPNLETTTKKSSSLNQNLEAKLYRFPDKQSARPSGSLPSNIQPNLKGMLNCGKFLKELISNKHKLEQISSDFLSDESSAMIQNKVPPKLGDIGSFLIPQDFDALLEEGSEILHSIKGTILEEQLFTEFDEFMAMNIEENSKSGSETEEIPFEKITFDTDYKIKTSLEEPPSDLELKPLPNHL